MTLEEIKEGVLNNRTICWKNKNYHVVCDNLGQWLILCLSNRSSVGLTQEDGVTLNELQEDFFCLDEVEFCPREWVFERSSDYLGYRNIVNGSWIYQWEYLRRYDLKFSKV